MSMYNPNNAAYTQPVAAIHGEFGSNTSVPAAASSQQQGYNNYNMYNYSSSANSSSYSDMLSNPSSATYQANDHAMMMPPESFAMGVQQPSQTQISSHPNQQQQLYRQTQQQQQHQQQQQYQQLTQQQQQQNEAFMVQSHYSPQRRSHPSMSQNQNQHPPISPSHSSSRPSSQGSGGGVDPASLAGNILHSSSGPMNQWASSQLTHPHTNPMLSPTSSQMYPPNHNPFLMPNVGQSYPSEMNNMNYSTSTGVSQPTMYHHPPLQEQQHMQQQQTSHFHQTEQYPNVSRHPSPKSISHHSQSSTSLYNSYPPQSSYPPQRYSPASQSHSHSHSTGINSKDRMPSNNISPAFSAQEHSHNMLSSGTYPSNISQFLFGNDPMPAESHNHQVNYNSHAASSAVAGVRSHNINNKSPVAPSGPSVGHRQQILKSSPSSKTNAIVGGSQNLPNSPRSINSSPQRHQHPPGSRTSGNVPFSPPHPVMPPVKRRQAEERRSTDSLPSYQLAVGDANNLSLNATSHQVQKLISATNRRLSNDSTFSSHQNQRSSQQLRASEAKAMAGAGTKSNSVTSNCNPFELFDINHLRQPQNPNLNPSSKDTVPQRGGASIRAQSRGVARRGVAVRPPTGRGAPMVRGRGRGNNLNERPRPAVPSNIQPPRAVPQSHRNIMQWYKHPDSVQSNSPTSDKEVMRVSACEGSNQHASRENSRVPSNVIPLKPSGSNIVHHSSKNASSGTPARASLGSQVITEERIRQIVRENSQPPNANVKQEAGVTKSLVSSILQHPKSSSAVGNQINSNQKRPQASSFHPESLKQTSSSAPSRPLLPTSSHAWVNSSPSAWHSTANSKSFSSTATSTKAFASARVNSPTVRNMLVKICQNVSSSTVTASKNILSRIKTEPSSTYGGSARDKVYSMWKAGQVVGRAPSSKAKNSNTIVQSTAPVLVSVSKNSTSSTTNAATTSLATATTTTTTTSTVSATPLTSSVVSTASGRSEKSHSSNSVAARSFKKEPTEMNPDTIRAKSGQMTSGNDVHVKLEPVKPPFSIKFHGHNIMCLHSKPQGSVIVLCQFLMECFPDKGKGNVSNCINRALRIRQRALEHPASDKIKTYLINNGFLSTKLECDQVSVISVNDARRVYHYMYSIKNCSSASCIVVTPNQTVDLDAVMPKSKRETIARGVKMMMMKKEKVSSDDRNYGRLSSSVLDSSNKQYSKNGTEQMKKGNGGKESTPVSSNSIQRHTAMEIDEEDDPDELIIVEGPENPFMIRSEGEKHVGRVVKTIIGRIRSYCHKGENYLVVPDLCKILGYREFMSVVEKDNVDMFSCCNSTLSFLNSLHGYFAPINSGEDCLIKEKDIGSYSGDDQSQSTPGHADDAIRPITKVNCKQEVVEEEVSVAVHNSSDGERRTTEKRPTPSDGNLEDGVKQPKYSKTTSSSEFASPCPLPSATNDSSNTILVLSTKNSKSANKTVTIASPTLHDSSTNAHLEPKKSASLVETTTQNEGREETPNFLNDSKDSSVNTSDGQLVIQLDESNSDVRPSPNLKNTSETSSNDLGDSDTDKIGTSVAKDPVTVRKTVSTLDKPVPCQDKNSESEVNGSLTNHPQVCTVIDNPCKPTSATSKTVEEKDANSVSSLVELLSNESATYNSKHNSVSLSSFISSVNETETPSRPILMTKLDDPGLPGFPVISIVEKEAEAQDVAKTLTTSSSSTTNANANIPIPSTSIITESHSMPFSDSTATTALSKIEQSDPTSTSPQVNKQVQSSTSSSVSLLSSVRTTSVSNSSRKSVDDLIKSATSIAAATVVKPSPLVASQPVAVSVSDRPRTPSAKSRSSSCDSTVSFLQAASSPAFKSQPRKMVSAVTHCADDLELLNPCHSAHQDVEAHKTKKSLLDAMVLLRYKNKALQDMVKHLRSELRVTKKKNEKASKMNQYYENVLREITATFKASDESEPQVGGNSSAPICIEDDD